MISGGFRFASKKAGSGARWQGNCKRSKKYRGLKRKDGESVTGGTVLATQITLRFFPGLNVRSIKIYLTIFFLPYY